MKHKLLIAAATTALMAAPSFASAQDQSGWYLKGAAGYGIGTDIDIEQGSIFAGVEGDVEAEGNVAGNVGLGYDFGENWRVELDGTTLFNDFGAVSQAPSSFAKLRTDSLMLNAIYDFSDFGSFAPYIGAGLGIIRGDATVVAHDFPEADNSGQIVSPVCNGPRLGQDGIDGFTCDFDGNDTALGFQLLAGLGYDITDKLTWDTNYRYQQSGDLDYDGVFVNGATGISAPATVQLDGVGNHLSLIHI